MLERRRERTRELELGLELELELELQELRAELEVLRELLLLEVGSWAQAGCARVPSSSCGA